MAKIILKIDGKPDKEYPIKGTLKIGRRSTNDISLNDNLCSREHCQIIEAGGSYKIRDLGSHNGTLLNGVKVNDTILKEGDIVSIGAVNLLFEKGDLDDLLGERVSGYKILQRLGEGGMGRVYKARQISMDREVALKVLSDKVTRDTSYIKAFIQEAKVAGQLNHNNVVNVHDFGKTEEGVYFLSMEFVDGENIMEILEKKGKLSTEQSVIIISQVTAALKYAHKNNIIHSDIKPQNIMLDRNGTVKLGDLGLAKYYGKGTFDSDPDIVMGTPFYMSPEQATKGKVDHRTDIYSLGATFFHMITGRPPFDGETALSILTKHVTEAVPSPRKYDVTISNEIAKIIKWMMEKNPGDRPADMAEVEQSLDGLKSQEQNKTALHTARRGYAADAKRVMLKRRKRSHTKRIAGQIAPLLFIIAVAVAGMIGYRKYSELQLKKTSPPPVPAVEPDPVIPETPAAYEPLPPETVPEPPLSEPVTVEPIRPAVLTRLLLDFNDLSQRDSLQPTGANGWSGWGFEFTRGFLETPPGITGGVRITEGQFRANGFLGELVLEILEEDGSISCFLEGAEGERLGVHLNPEEVILFSGTQLEKVAMQRDSNKPVSIVLDNRRIGQLVVGVGGHKVGTLNHAGVQFLGNFELKLEGTAVRIHSIKIGTPED